MNYEQFLPPLLAVFGGALQWLRQHKTISDTVIGVIAVVAAIAAYMMVHVLGSDWRMEVIQAVLIIPANAATVLGGTFMANSAANSGFAVVPKENSK